MFTADQAEQIVQFCNRNKDKQEIYIHCAGGISRSGAVGEFVNDNWSEDSYQDFKLRNHSIYPNVYVLRVLRQVYDDIRYLQMS